MPTNEVKDQHKLWLEALSTSDDTTVCELASIIFDLSSTETRLEVVLAGDRSEAELTRKKESCISLLTSSLTANSMQRPREDVIRRGIYDSKVPFQQSVPASFYDGPIGIGQRIP